MSLSSGNGRRRSDLVRRDTVDIDQVFTHHDARNTNTLFDMVDRDAVQVEAPPAAKITTKRETARVAEQCSRLFDSRTDRRHGI